MSDTILHLPEVMKRTGLGKTNIYERADFPRRISLGGRAVGWVASEVDAWIQERIAESRKAA